jgi:hypothetical protein
MMKTPENIQQEPKTARKTRSPFDKEGSFKYLQKTLHRFEDKLDDVRRQQRYMIKGLDLAHQLLFDRVYIHDTVCINEPDQIILEDLYAAGHDGKLPKDVATTLNKHLHSRHYKPWHVRYALKRMNRKLEQQIGQEVAEKRGLRWALTSLTRKAWGRTKEDVLEER